MSSIQTSPPKSGLPLIVAGLLISVVFAAVATYLVAEHELPRHLAFRRIMSITGIIVIPVTGVIVFLVIWLSNRLKRPIDGNITAGLSLGAAIVVILGGLQWDSRIHAKGQALLNGVTGKLYGQIASGAEAYEKSVTDAKITVMLTPGALYNDGFNAAADRARLDKARQEATTLNTALAAKAADARKALAAVKVGSSQKKGALADFDAEFSKPGGRLPTYFADQTARLDSYAAQVDALAKGGWSARTRWVVFEAPGATEAYGQLDTERRRAEGEIGSLMQEFRRKAI